MTTTLVTDAEKAAVHAAHVARRPTRVPVVLYTNQRVVLMNPEWNPEGFTFEQAAADPETHVRVSLLHQLYRRRVIHRYCDDPTELPEVWDVDMMVYNVYDAACLGAEVNYTDDQVPDTEPFLDEADRESIFEIDVTRPLELPFMKRWLAFWDEMEKVCEGMSFEGRPVRMVPWWCTGFDGPVTVGCNVRGTDFLMDLIAEPEFADRLMHFVTDLAIHRRDAMFGYWKDRGYEWSGINGFADDSCAMLSPDMYAERIVPLHRRWYDAGPPDVERAMHMCGDATRLFPILTEKLGVTRFDTGFPVDHGALRDTLGPDVHIMGGPQIALLTNGAPDQVAARTQEILTSGVTRGGRFMLREGHNLPPNVPEANLAAMYETALEYGVYSD